MVQDLKKLFDLMAREAVVEGGGEVEENHAGGEHDARNHGPSVFGNDADDDEGGDGGDYSKTMGDGRGEFFAR